MALNYVQSLTLYLSGSGVIVGATTASLTTLTDIYGNVLTMADFGAKGYVTFEPDTTNEESATFTGITANANGTYTLTGISTTLAKSPYTETSGLVRAHSGGTKIVITDNVAFWNTFANKANNETITGTWTFNTAPSSLTSTPASTTVLGNTKLTSTPSTTLGNPTITIASPAVITLASHGLINGDTVQFTTTGAFPTGIVANTTYYVIAAGLTTNAFEVSLIPAGTAVNTSGSQSGTHTLLRTTPFAVGNDDVRLVGTSGTALSSSNHPVDQSDTVGTGKTVRASLVKWGGTGADGALSVNTGTTNIDCAGAQFLVKNYTTIAITGNGVVKFINPHANGTTIWIKYTTSCTLTSSATPMLDASGMGAIGGTAVSVSASSVSIIPGNNGSLGYGFSPFPSNFGLGSTSATAGTDGAVSTTVSLQSFVFNSVAAAYKYGMALWVGAGGGSGSAYNNTGGTLSLTSGAGGRGGGCLILEGAGSWNFTTAGGISVAGTTGAAATGSGTTNGKAGGGGGGAAGFFISLYNTLTANTGTVTVTGGAVGADTAGTGNAAHGGAGANQINPGASGVGAAGLSYTALNTEYA